MVTALDEAGCVETVKAIRDVGGTADYVVADVRRVAELRAAVQHTVDTFGRLDTLVTSAGIQRYGTVYDTTVEEWDEVFDVNVKGVFLSVQAALPYLRRAPAGAIVVVSSVQSRATQQNVAAYTATKGALNALVRSIAVDEAPHGVRVNTVCPGSVDTPMLRWSAALFSNGEPGAVQRTIDEWGRSHPLGRVATAREVAEVISFLTSERASFVTGSEVTVDGGLLATVAVALPSADATSGPVMPATPADVAANGNAPATSTSAPAVDAERS